MIILLNVNFFLKNSPYPHTNELGQEIYRARRRKNEKSALVS